MCWGGAADGRTLSWPHSTAQLDRSHVPCTPMPCKHKCIPAQEGYIMLDNLPHTQSPVSSPTTKKDSFTLCHPHVIVNNAGNHFKHLLTCHWLMISDAPSFRLGLLTLLACACQLLRSSPCTVFSRSNISPLFSSLPDRGYASAVLSGLGCSSIKLRSAFSDSSTYPSRLGAWHNGTLVKMTQPSLMG